MKQRLLSIAALTFSLSLICYALFFNEPTNAQSVIEMKIATVAPEGTPWEKQIKRFKEYVETKSGGRIKVRVFMGGSLGGEKAIVSRTSQGSIHAYGGSPAALASIVRELNVIEAPYLYSSYDEADRSIDSAGVKAQIQPMLSKKGFVFGFWAENGFRHWFTREKAIRAPADLRGLRMRSTEATVHLETYRAFGANPQPIDVTNVLTSLQTGAVDGFDNTYLFSFATSWYQAAKHLTTSAHNYQPGIIVYSKTWFDSLPEDLKPILQNVPPNITTDGRADVRRMEPILLRNLKTAGINVVDLSTAERDAFKAIARPVQDRVAGRTGAGGRALLKALRAH